MLGVQYGHCLVTASVKIGHRTGPVNTPGVCTAGARRATNKIIISGRQLTLADQTSGYLPLRECVAFVHVDGMRGTRTLKTGFSQWRADMRGYNDECDGEILTQW